MSEEKPPEPTSAPLRPYWNMSERKGCVIALLLLGFAGLIVGVMWAGLDGYERDGIWSLASLIFKIILGVLLHILLDTVLGPILLILVPVIGGVLLACKMRYKPPIAPPPLPRTQSEESSNQEEEKIQPGKEN